MNEYSWIHLACHGIQDTARLTENAFHFIDNPLTLKEIMKESFGDSKLPEEAIHLASRVLMAGYGNVVGADDEVDSRP
jgi:CHAT domain-containing protein